MANIIKIWAIHKYLTVQSCTTLVLMLCITHLDYANAMLYSLPLSTLRKYQTIQNTCTKLILNKERYLSSSWALKNLYWLSIQQRIEHKILTTTFKCITGMASKYLQAIISIKTTHRTICDLATQAPCYTHQKSSTKPLQHSPHVFCTNIMEAITKIHQRFTNLGHLQEEAKDTSILAGLQPKLTLLLKLNE